MGSEAVFKQDSLLKIHSAVLATSDTELWHFWNDFM